MLSDNEEESEERNRYHRWPLSGQQVLEVPVQIRCYCFLLISHSSLSDYVEISTWSQLVVVSKRRLGNLAVKSFSLAEVFVKLCCGVFVLSLSVYGLPFPSSVWLIDLIEFLPMDQKLKSFKWVLAILQISNVSFYWSWCKAQHNAPNILVSSVAFSVGILSRKSISLSLVSQKFFVQKGLQHQFNRIFVCYPHWPQCATLLAPPRLAADPRARITRHKCVQNTHAASAFICIAFPWFVLHTENDTWHDLLLMSLNTVLAINRQGNTFLNSHQRAIRKKHSTWTWSKWSCMHSIYWQV